MQKLETKHISKHFNGVQAVQNLSLSFEAGKITGIIGPNGSGKTTFINLISGMISFDAGVVMLDGVSLHKIIPHDVATYGVTRTFQDVRLFEQMTVLDNILLTQTERSVWGSLFERHASYHVQEAQRVLERVGLWHKKDALASQLSYGQRKLLEIARVLAMRVDVILLDEPFAGLFPEMVLLIETIIRELRNQGKIIVLIEHNMDIMRVLCDVLYVVDEGKLLAGGIPSEVLSRPDVMEAYLGE